MSLLHMLDSFGDYSTWADDLERGCGDFLRRFGVRPNIVAMSAASYGNVLARARSMPGCWRDWDGEEAVPCFEGDGACAVPADWTLDYFSAAGSTLAFAIDDSLGNERFRLVHDTEPVFDGQPTPEEEAYAGARSA